MSGPLSPEQDRIAEVVNKTFSAVLAARATGDKELEAICEAAHQAATSRRREGVL